MDVRQIVKEYLEQHGFDGLCNCDGECGCLKEDLCPCTDLESSCEPGYKVECANCDRVDGYDFIVTTVHPSERNGKCPRCGEKLNGEVTA